MSIFFVPSPFNHYNYKVNKKELMIIEFGPLISQQKQQQQKQRFNIPFCLNSSSFQKACEAAQNIIFQKFNNIQK